MKLFSNMKISTRLITGFICVALIAGIVGAAGLYILREVGTADKELFEQNTMGLNTIGNADIAFQRSRYNVFRALAITDPKVFNNCLSAATDFLKQADDYMAQFKSCISTPEEQQLYDNLKKTMEAFKPNVDKAIALLRANDFENARVVVTTTLQTTGNDVQTAFDNIFQYVTDLADTKADSNTNLISFTSKIMIIVIALAMFIAVFLGIIISRGIAKPVKKLMAAADKLAEGDIDVDINIHTKDEVGRLAESFQKLVESTEEQVRIAESIADGNLTIESSIRSDNDVLGKSMANLLVKLNEILETVVITADQVSSGSDMVSTSSMTLSQGATEQASSIEELTASITEIAAQITNNAQNAKVASDLAQQAETYANEGNSQMKDMLSAMSEIHEESQNINKIIKVIDDIAFQTNILALNAAVEAARAGQYGKGFAVVADEVRNLAARSANAAKETTDLILNSIKKVNAGTSLANNTAAALNQIVGKITEVSSIVNNIASASGEQSAGVEQINQGVLQISQVVQTNAATSEESAGASEELSNQATKLKEIVSVFKLKDEANILNNLQAAKSAHAKLSHTEAKSKIVLGPQDFDKY